MDFAILFGLGVLGALIVIYIAKQEVVPEFRPLFDTTRAQQDADQIRKHIANTRKEVDEAQKELRSNKLPPEQLNQISKFIDSSLDEIKQEDKRQKEMDDEIKQGQVISRTLGFIIYAILGGAIAALLSDKVEVKGFDAALPKQFQAVFVGASWTGFLSVLGFSKSGTQTKNEIESLRKDLKDSIDDKVKETIEKVTKEYGSSGLPASPEILKNLTSEMAFNLNKMIDTKADRTNIAVQRVVKGIL